MRLMTELKIVLNVKKTDSYSKQRHNAAEASKKVSEDGSERPNVDGK